MAFFGLTALGPQNSFAACMKMHSDMDAFSDDDWLAAFDEASNDGTVPKEGLPALLQALYKGPPREGDQDLLLQQAQRVCSRAGSEWSGVVVRSDVAKLAAAVRAELTRLKADDTWRAQASCGIVSNEEYRNRVKRCRGLTKGPRDTCCTPVTAAQDLGWQQAPPGTEAHCMHSKKSCPETMFAAEMVKSGGLYF